MGLFAEIRTKAKQLSYELGNPLLESIIEKELLHYEILDVMLAEEQLGGCVFQGGTCLRLCYGSPRYSEDLDFAADSMDAIRGMADLPQKLEEAFLAKHDEHVTVKDPAARIPEGDDRIAMKRWEFRARIAERRDLPMQKVKLEAAVVPSYTAQSCRIRFNYEDAQKRLPIMDIRAESLEEIFADKIVSFAMASYPRWRDLWDLRWIQDQPGFCEEKARSFVEMKVDDYRCSESFPGRISEAIAKLPQMIESAEFPARMEYLLDPEITRATVLNGSWRMDAVKSLTETFRSVEEATKSRAGASLGAVKQECVEASHESDLNHNAETRSGHDKEGR